MPDAILNPKQSNGGLVEGDLTVGPMLKDVILTSHESNMELNEHYGPEWHSPYSLGTHDP